MFETQKVRKDSVKYKMLKDSEPYLQLKSSNLWFGVVQGRDGCLEGVKDGNLHHMDWKVIPLHNYQGKGVFIVALGSGDLSKAIRVAASRNPSNRLHKIFGEGDCFMIVDNSEK